MENNENKRGRPQGSPNINPTLKKLKNNRDLVKREVSKKAGLFVVKQMDKLDDLFDQLTPSAKAKLLTELMRFSTTTYAEEIKLKNIQKETKDIKEIKISYEKPSLPPAPVIIEYTDAEVEEDDDIIKSDESEDEEE